VRYRMIDSAETLVIDGRHALELPLVYNLSLTKFQQLVYNSYCVVAFTFVGNNCSKNVCILVD
jgi:hypothetical protein